MIPNLSLSLVCLERGVVHAKGFLPVMELVDYVDQILQHLCSILPVPGALRLSIISIQALACVMNGSS